MIPSALQGLRVRVRDLRIPSFYNGYLHLFVNNAIAVAACIWAFSHITLVSPLELLVLPGVWLYANFAEYWVHRLGLHRDNVVLHFLFELHALEHHRFFTHEHMEAESAHDYAFSLYPPFVGLIVFVFVGGCLPLLAAYAFGPPNLVWWLIGGGIVYFMFYESVELSNHAQQDSFLQRMPIYRALRVHHRAHHKEMAKHNFNIAFPLCDWIFGTLR